MERRPQQHTYEKDYESITARGQKGPGLWHRLTEIVAVAPSTADRAVLITVPALGFLGFKIVGADWSSIVIQAVGFWLVVAMLGLIGMTAVLRGSTRQDHAKVEEANEEASESGDEPAYARQAGDTPR